jgi:phage major head subunit gpT-like protein
MSTINTNAVPSRLTLSADFAVAAAVSEGSQPTFRLVAYTGAPIRQSWSRNALVLDLAGMDLSNQTIPILFGHDASLESVVGQATAVTTDGSTLIVEGVVLGVSETAQRVLELARRGMKFQASVGADVGRIENIQSGESVQVNNRSFAGPVSIVRGSALRETSIVLMGADGNTSASIAAKEVDMADPATQTPDETHVSAEATAPVAVETSNPEIVAAAPVATPAIDKEQLVKEIKADILADLRTSRAPTPAIHVQAEPVDGVKVVEAALCKQAGLPHLDKAFDGRTLEAADKVVRDVSISQVLLKAAKANGYAGSDRITQANVMPMLQASFATHDISNLLAALVNKFLLAGFMAVERSWQEIAAIRSVADFKAINLMRLNGSLKFQKIGNAGELKVAAVNDYKRSVNADTWGISTQLTRQDIINDDLNALSLVPQRMGRGAALAMNDAIWAEFLSSNSTYYQSVTAAAGNALAYAGLETAVTAYRRLNDPDGNPLSIAPRIILCPPELEPKAVQLMTQSALITTSYGGTSSKVVEPSANPFVGRYKIVTSNYLPAAGTVANSTWWLLADPADLSALDVVFLNGQQVPTIEQVMIDYQLLGVGLRGYLDFGVIKSEPLSCLRMATA